MLLKIEAMGEHPMVEKYILIPLSELVCMEVNCPKCGTKIAFDAVTISRCAPAKCPSCSHDFGLAPNGLPSTVGKFRMFFAEMQNLGLNASFRVTEKS